MPSDPSSPHPLTERQAALLRTLSAPGAYLLHLPATDLYTADAWRIVGAAWLGPPTRMDGRFTQVVRALQTRGLLASGPDPDSLPNPPQTVRWRSSRGHPVHTYALTEAGRAEADRPPS